MAPPVPISVPQFGSMQPSLALGLGASEALSMAMPFSMGPAPTEQVTRGVLGMTLAEALSTAAGIGASMPIFSLPHASWAQPVSLMPFSYLRPPSMLPPAPAVAWAGGPGSVPWSLGMVSGMDAQSLPPMGTQIPRSLGLAQWIAQLMPTSLVPSTEQLIASLWAQTPVCTATSTTETLLHTLQQARVRALLTSLVSGVGAGGSPLSSGMPVSAVATMPALVPPISVGQMYAMCGLPLDGATAAYSGPHGMEASSGPRMSLGAALDASMGHQSSGPGVSASSGHQVSGGPAHPAANAASGGAYTGEWMANLVPGMSATEANLARIFGTSRLTSEADALEILDRAMAHVQHRAEQARQQSAPGAAAAELARTWRDGTVANMTSKSSTPKKGVEKRYDGKIPWKKYLMGPLADFFLLHRISDVDKGLYAYMALDDGPRMYVNATLGAPVADPTAHIAWMEREFRRAGSLERLNAVMQRNPAYSPKDTDVSNLAKLEALYIAPDASDLVEQCTEFQRLLAELRHVTPISPREEFMHLMHMISPSARLWEKVRTKPDSTDWFAGVPFELHADVMQHVYDHMLRIQTEHVQRQAERNRLLNHRGRAGPADLRQIKQESKGKGKAGGSSQQPFGKRPRGGTGAGPSTPHGGGKKPKPTQGGQGAKPVRSPAHKAARAYRMKHGLCFWCGDLPIHKAADCEHPQVLASDPRAPVNEERDAARWAEESASGGSNDKGKGPANPKRTFGKGGKGGKGGDKPAKK